jgi:uncharacterized protein YecA (UPF0149 family)
MFGWILGNRDLAKRIETMERNWIRLLHENQKLVDLFEQELERPINERVADMLMEQEVKKKCQEAVRAVNLGPLIEQSIALAVDEAIRRVDLAGRGQIPQVVKQELKEKMNQGKV